MRRGKACYGHRPALFRQPARSNVTIPPIIARPTQHQYPAWPNMLANGACDGAARIFHQHRHRHAARGGGIDMAHFRRIRQEQAGANRGLLTFVCGHCIPLPNNFDCETALAHVTGMGKQALRIVPAHDAPFSLFPDPGKEAPCPTP
ncbi:hypothetical protein AA0614_1515 [Komagataeibacter saccharivorans NRIC 0614]|nr:hypothetical protein AA0614_1515 [Komagataeibacter saccharivorans NRIC 0614]